MMNTRVRISLAVAVGIMAAGAVRVSAQRMEAAQLGAAPAMYRGMALQGAVANINTDGGGYAEFRYATPGPAGAGERRALLIQAYWMEKAREGQQRVLYPRIQINGSNDGVFSTSHQIHVHVSATYPEVLAPAEGLPLARSIAAALQNRALRWDDDILTFNPPERIEEIHLYDSRLNSYKYADDDTGYRTADFKYTTPVWDVRGQVLPRGWRTDLRIEWQKQARRMDQSMGKWDMSAAERRIQERSDPTNRILIYSPTHQAKAIVGGERWDGTQRKWVPLFQDEHYRNRAVALARRFLAVAEAKLALPRPGGGMVVDRPPPAGPPPSASGSVLSIAGPVMVIRNGQRVNVVAGGRVAKGDVILMGKGGQVHIRFDDSRAGPDRSGVLIASMGRHVIDADPVRGTPNVRVTVQDGAARFIRPEIKTGLDVALAVEGTLFGQVSGTDALVVHYAEPDLALLAVEEGRAEVTLRREGLLLMEGASQVRTVTPTDRLTVLPGWILRVPRAGPVLLSRLKEGDYANFLRSLSLEQSASR